MSETALQGVIHGRTIELDADAGLADGERVEVIVRPVEATPDVESHGSEDASAIDEVDWDEWDAIMKEVQAARKIERRGASAEE